jgi:integrase/recombinase XerD
LTTGTTIKARAIAMERTLYSLRDAGRRDILSLLANRRVTLPEVHGAYSRNPAELEHLRARAESPALGDLVEEWLAWCRSPAGVSPRTKRRYAPQTVRRYRVSWEGFFEILPRARASRVSDITTGFIAEYKNARVRAEGGAGRNTRKDGTPPTAATLNRDLVALTSFLTWCAEVKGLSVQRPRILREREPQGRERWLSSGEVRALVASCEPDWWALFATLLHTGMRIGEAQGLVWGDVRLAQRRITIHEANRRVKTIAAVRDVPISEPLAEILAQQAARVPSNPADAVFPVPFNNYAAARHAWSKVCIQAGLHDGGPNPKPNATIHDLRHTFGVSAARAGVPIVRLQKLLGHSTPHMTLRYMKHAPEAFFREDAAKIADALTGVLDDERDVRVEGAQGALKKA